MLEDVPRQLGDEEAPPHPRAAGPRVRGVREGICRVEQVKTSPTGTHGRETISGGLKISIYFALNPGINNMNSHFSALSRVAAKDSP